ncbi:hypothetical protein [Halopenitus sp. POP-27]|uniref:DUF7554 family protein n=1 Tax=Halopenitus sp. POP-27 TaxID=2994425 RepID=UPI002469B8BC|nr:hypothetical protein [Halopenitus sp. POP-27]
MTEAREDPARCDRERRVRRGRGREAPRRRERGSIDVEDLLKVILGLVIVWLALEILGQLVNLTFAVVRALPTIIGIVIVVVIVLWLTDNL